MPLRGLKACVRGKVESGQVCVKLVDWLESFGAWKGSVASADGDRRAEGLGRTVGSPLPPPLLPSMHVSTPIQTRRSLATAFTTQSDLPLSDSCR